MNSHSLLRTLSLLELIFVNVFVCEQDKTLTSTLPIFKLRFHFDLNTPVECHDCVLHG